MKIAISAHPIRFGATKHPETPIKALVDKFKAAVELNNTAQATNFQAQLIAALPNHVTEGTYNIYGESPLCDPLDTLVELCEPKEGFQPSEELRRRVLQSYFALGDFVQCPTIGDEGMDILDPTGKLRNE